MHAQSRVFNSVQSLSRIQLFGTPRTAARQASLSIINSHSLLKLWEPTQTGVGDAIQPSHPLSSPSLPKAERQACDSQSWKARGCYNLGPREGIFHQTVSRLPAANHVFLRSWMVDICQEGCSLRSALQRRHGIPEMVLSQHTQETKQPGQGR